MKRVILFGTYALILTFVFACVSGTPIPPTPTARAVPGIEVIIDPPNSGSVLDLGPVTVDEYINSTTCCVRGTGIYVNGHSVAARNLTGSLSNTTQTFSWTPRAAGEYFLQGYVLLSTGTTALSQASRVCVLGNFSGDPFFSGYLGPCAIPTSIPTLGPVGYLTISDYASPDPITILPLDCTGNVYPTITINATFHDPADQVFLADAYVAVNGFGGNYYLNWYGSEPDGTKLFHGTYTPDNGNPTINSIIWNVGGLDRTGHGVGYDPVHNLTINHGTCSHEQSATNAPLQIVPSATPGTLIANVQAYPSPIYYGNTCPSVSNLSFRTALLLPNGTDASQLQVLAHINVDDSNGSPAGSLSVPLMSNGTFDTASGGLVFLGSLDLSHAYNDANNQFDPASLGGANGSLHWYITVANQNTELGRSSEQILNLAPCPTYSKPTSQPSSGSNTCNLSAGYCQNLGKKLDTATCSCVP